MIEKSQQNRIEVVTRPAKNQSIAQLIYAENRKKARASHAMLEKFNPMCETFGPGCDLPLYNQPSDMTLYYTNKQRHSTFKPHLVERFKRKIEEKESRERYLTETYSSMMAQVNTYFSSFFEVTRITNIE